MKHKVWNAIRMLLFVAGLAVFLYPIGAGYISEQKAQSIISDFNEAAKEIQQAEPEQSGETPSLRRLYSDMQEYNRNLYENGQDILQDPFSCETPAFDLTRYGFDDNMVGYISIPRMAVELPIYLGASKPDLDLGAGNLGYTSILIGGVNTNTVLAAHRGYRDAAMFRDIEELQIRDRIYITNFWETLAYEVTETKVILPAEVQEVYIQEGRDMVTLITCHPYTKNHQRYVVYCERVESTDTTKADTTKADTDTQPDPKKILHWNELSESGRFIFVEHRLFIGIPILLLLFILIRLILGVSAILSKSQ